MSRPIERSNGTMNFLRSLPRGRVIYGKTGTFDTTSGNVKDKYVVGILKVKGQYYSFSILIGSEAYAGKGLINTISSKVLFKPIIQSIVDSLYYE